MRPGAGADQILKFWETIEKIYRARTVSGREIPLARHAAGSGVRREPPRVSRPEPERLLHVGGAVGPAPGSGLCGQGSAKRAAPAIQISAFQPDMEP